MRHYLPANLLVATGGLLAILIAPSVRADGLDDAVLAEMNYARTHPAEYARELQRVDVSAPSDRGWSLLDDQDPGALAEAIEFLEHQAPLPPLRSDSRLAASASDHTVAQGPRGQIGHVGPDGVTFSQRLTREGVWAGLSAEAISYGYDTPRDVVRQLVIDSGVANRGHRADVFGHAYQAAGVSCGAHAVWGAMCVIDFAGSLVSR